MRGETSGAKDLDRENEILQRDIIATRDEIAQVQAEYEAAQQRMQEKRGRVKECEDRLRYGNEVIMQLEAEI